MGPYELLSVCRIFFSYMWWEIVYVYDGMWVNSSMGHWIFSIDFFFLVFIFFINYKMGKRDEKLEILLVLYLKCYGRTENEILRWKRLNFLNWILFYFGEMLTDTYLISFYVSVHYIFYIMWYFTVSRNT